jgi:hypothetical protein
MDVRLSVFSLALKARSFLLDGQEFAQHDGFRPRAARENI